MLTPQSPAGYRIAIAATPEALNAMSRTRPAGVYVVARTAATAARMTLASATGADLKRRAGAAIRVTPGECNARAVPSRESNPRGSDLSFLATPPIPRYRGGVATFQQSYESKFRVLLGPARPGRAGQGVARRGQAGRG